MIERHIDYLQFSANFKEIDCIYNQYEMIPPLKFYKRGYRMPTGFRLYFGNPNPKAQKAFVIASGDTMQNQRDLGLTDKGLLSWIFHEGGNITRMDLAVTQWQTFDGLITVGDVEKWYKQGLIDTALIKNGLAKGIYTIQLGENSLETLYIGDMKKRGKRGIFRAYDKGIELNLGEYMATRLEIEERGEKAQASAIRLEKEGDFSGVFRSRFDVRHKDFERLMDAPAMPTPRGKAKEKKSQSEEQEKRWDWLIKQVAPALRQAYRQDVLDGLGDANLTQFIFASGLGDEMIRAANILSEQKYHEALKRNEL